MYSLHTVLCFILCWNVITASWLVLDTGSAFIKVGSSDSALPEEVEHNLKGHPWLEFHGARDHFGDVAWRERASLDLVYPMDQGLVQHWPEQGEVWSYTFNDILQLNTNGLSVITSAPAGASEEYLQTLEETLRDDYGFTEVEIIPDAVLALHTAGGETGLVIQFGYSYTSIVPVIGGEVVTSAIKTLPVAGRLISTHLETLLNEITAVDLDIVNDIKENYCYIALDYQTEMTQPASALMEVYTLEDGREIELAYERFHVAEALFQPHLFGLSDPGVIQLAYEAILASPHASHEDLRHNVVLAGGTSLFPGMDERIQYDLSVMAEASVHVNTPANRQFAVWAGGASVAQGMDNN